MTHAAWLLALLLAVPSTAAAQKDKDKDKDKKKQEAAAKTTVSAEDLVRQAEEKAAAGDAAGAKELMEKAAAMPTASGDVSLKLGRLLQSTHDLDASMDAYKSAGDKLTGAAKGEALGRLAIVQETRGVPEFAATAEAAAAADKDGPFPNIALARLRAREGKGDEALALAQKATAAGGADAQAAVGRAQEARNALAEAEAAYRAGGGADGTNLTATVGLARVLRRTGRAAEALPLLEKVIAAAPGAVDAYKESARAKIAAGRGADAFGDASTAAALAEHDADAALVVQEATVAKALAYVAQNQAALAIQDLTALRDKSPDLAIARVGLGRAYASNRQVDLAIVELKKAVELDPTSAEAQYQLGYVQHMLKRDAAAAIGPYEKAVAAEPGTVDYRTQLGAGLAAANQADRAVAELTKVTSTPGYQKADAWIFLGQAQLGAKRYKDALASLDKAAAIAPNNMQIETFMAWSYFGLKDSKNFVDHGRKARTLGQKEPTLLGYLTRIEAGEPIK
jgi:tetratricopeptide (TPR) repeat protein